jgi:transposase-like protein
MTGQPKVPRFTPVPTRARRDGWTPDKQRAFLLALRRTGQVALAAREVGMSHQSARALRKRAGAESFAAAWDLVLDQARGDALDAAIERATEGVLIPRFRRGRFVRLDHRPDDNALITALRFASARPPGS